jgi:hypothetical protein
MVFIRNKRALGGTGKGYFQMVAMLSIRGAGASKVAKYP